MKFIREMRLSITYARMRSIVFLRAFFRRQIAIVYSSRRWIDETAKVDPIKAATANRSELIEKERAERSDLIEAAKLRSSRTSKRYSSEVTRSTESSFLTYRSLERTTTFDIRCRRLREPTIERRPLSNHLASKSTPSRNSRTA